MSSIGDSAKAIQGRWFVIALLLALASALVPALCSQGLPATRTVGSAFDPTTSTVALRSRAQLIDRAHVVLPDSLGDDAPSAMIGPVLVPQLPMPGTFAAIIDPTAQAASNVAARETLRRMTLARPRAPPIPAV